MNRILQRSMLRVILVTATPSPSNPHVFEDATLGPTVGFAIPTIIGVRLLQHALNTQSRVQPTFSTQRHCDV